jgi:hypothetical protein
MNFPTGDNTPFDTAASVFGLYTPRLEALLKELSTGDLRRLINAVVQYPLNEKEFVTAGNKKLTEAFKLANELVRARSIMEFETVLALQAQENAAQSKDAVETPVSTPQSEVSQEVIG